MNKIILCFASIVLIGGAFAQETTNETFMSRKNFKVLPEAGDYAIGISVNPFMSYLGNLANGSNNNNAPTWDYAGNVFSSPLYNPFALPTIGVFGKRMNSATDAYRFRLDLGFLSRRDNVLLVKDTTVPDPNNPSFITDTRRIRSTSFALSLGKEYRRGKGRVQGVFGAEALFQIGKSRARYEYGNIMDQNFASPTTQNFGTNLIGGGGSSSRRVLNSKSGLFYGVGVRGFAGVEYFIGSKISIGGEFGYSIRYIRESKGSFTSEALDPGSLKVVEQTRDTPNSYSSFSLGLDNLSGTINMFFYF